MTNILVVDDQSLDRELAARCMDPLEELEVSFAESGEEALEKIPASVPDLVLTDLRMPGMDGLELVEKIRDRWPELPVVLMTSQGSETIAVKALKAGAASYVPKRDLKESLADTIEQVLDVTRARRVRGRVVGFLSQCHTKFELENDPDLIYSLAGFFEDTLERLGFGTATDRTQIGMALMEAISNAMIHGNLEVASKLRRESRSAYTKLIGQRRGEKPYSERRVRCMAKESPEKVEYLIEDEGSGFDPHSLPDPTSPENMLNVSGRGVMLMRTFMDQVEFNGKGNSVTMIKLGNSVDTKTGD